MQKQRGKAWEKESRALRQVDMRVDVRGGGARRRISRSFLWYLVQELWDCNIWKTAHCSVDSRLINAKFMSYNNRTPTPPTLLFLPGLPLPLLHAASDQKLEPGMAWEWGYCDNTLLCSTWKEEPENGASCAPFWHTYYFTRLWSIVHWSEHNT